jgi:glycosyltransferase involved in cell wall biosynthesis
VRLRLALVYAHLHLGASLPRQQVELARYLVRAGHEVHVYYHEAGSEVDLVPGACFHSVPASKPSGSRLGLPLHVASFAWNATRMLQQDRAAYDVVHGRGMSTWEQDIVHVTGVVKAEIARDRAARDDDQGLARRFKDLLLPAAAPIVLVRQAIERRIFEKETPLEIHTDSGMVRDDVLAAYQMDSSRVHAVPPGVSLDEFRPPSDRRAARRDVGFTGNEAVVLFCGHSWKRKGLDRAIRALARMREPATLVVVGDGDVERYEGIARELGVVERVRFAGPRADSWRYFQAADVFVLPTRVDMWGMTIVEAMASGIPPITTTGAGASSVIGDGESGFVLAEPLDIELLASTCDRLVADPTLRERVGHAAAAQARTLTWSEHGRRVEAAMLDAAERRQRGPAAV